MISKNFLSEGFYLGKRVLNDTEINNLRLSLDEIFNSKGNPKELNLYDIKDENIIKLIYKVYNSSELKSFLKSLENEFDEKINLIPRFLIQRNYHVDRKKSPGIGWHRDCGGELNRSYSKNRLSDASYVFGKIGIYLQPNSEYGGSVDIIPGSHKSIKSKSFILKKLFGFKLYIITKIQKYFPFFYSKISEKIFMKILNAKRLFPNPGTFVAWDSRTIHRGTPIEDNSRSSTEFFQGKYQAEVPKKFTKYSLYVDFGNNFAFDSYMNDRNNRTYQSKEYDIIKKNLNHIKNFSNELYLDLQNHITVTLNKYQ